MRSCGAVLYAAITGARARVEIWGSLGALWGSGLPQACAHVRLARRVVGAGSRLRVDQRRKGAAFEA